MPHHAPFVGCVSDSSAMSPPRISLPTCPECGSGETVIAYERLGTTTYGCDACGCNWRIEHHTPEKDRSLAPGQRTSSKKGSVKRT